jgi:hypothetical protein
MLWRVWRGQGAKVMSSILRLSYCAGFDSVRESFIESTGIHIGGVKRSFPIVSSIGISMQYRWVFIAT